MTSFLANASQVLLFLLGVFLIIVILLQRGRGGGLAGAFGGMGGQSAFGTKAGDVFTRITIGLAIGWVILAGGSGVLLRAASQGTRAESFGSGNDSTTKTGDDLGAGAAGGTSSGGEGALGTTPETPAPTSGNPVPATGSGTPPSGAPAQGGAAGSGEAARPTPPENPESGGNDDTSGSSSAPGSAAPDSSESSPQDK